MLRTRRANVSKRVANPQIGHYENESNRCPPLVFLHFSYLPERRPAGRFRRPKERSAETLERRSFQTAAPVSRRLPTASREWPRAKRVGRRTSADSCVAQVDAEVRIAALDDTSRQPSGPLASLREQITREPPGKSRPRPPGSGSRRSASSAARACLRPQWLRALPTQRKGGVTFRGPIAARVGA